MAREPGNLRELPMFNTPFTRFTEHWFTFQKGPCADFEIDYVRCASAVGMHRAEKECRNYLDDFLECAWGIKAVKRYEIMQKERRKQSLAPVKKPEPDSVHVPIIF
ncbi:hypothetical protein NP493_23g06009 [Ridgeia piscesae]|uniref:NADH dehydrogenase [ubiquinone] iron-sulfur protein 5 n=1 Tax=Ridgeia piscesae TaxID=27915 RepID=A0AAD9PDE0_RIDPI|nr:hypothetical protein NP493_23g06009 [Ridgeia piscesae]